MVLFQTVLCVALPATRASENSNLQADVDVYFLDRVGMPNAMRNAVHTELAAIFRHAGVSVSWHVVGRDAEHAVRPERVIQVVLAWRHMLDRAVIDAGGSHQRSLGVTWVTDDGEQFSRTVLLLYENLAQVAIYLHPSMRGRHPIAAPGLQFVMARVIAHEMGHILLKSTAHSKHGIMRSRFTYRELTALKNGELCFSQEEGERLRYAVVQREQEERRRTEKELFAPATLRPTEPAARSGEFSSEVPVTAGSTARESFVPPAPSTRPSSP